MVFPTVVGGRGWGGVDPALEEERGPDGAGVEKERGTGVVKEERGTGMEEELVIGVVEEE
jgi:hypothetical protein